VGAPASKKDSKKDGDRKSAARSPKPSARSRAASASNAFSPDEEEAAPAPEESNTKNLIIAAVLVLGLAASGYYAWPRLQPALESLPIVQKYFGAPQSEVSPPLSPAVPAAPASAAASSAAGPEQPPSASASGPTTPPARSEESGRAVGSVEPNPAASAAASSSESAAVSGPRAAIAHPAAGRAAKPILVKDDRNQNPALQAGAAQPAAPAPLEIASSSGDQAIAGIVGTMAGAHPVLKPINVSQGVANGLLVKRVPPLYPTLALQMRVAGAVELQASINKDGSTANVQVLKGDPLLRPAAVDAVRQWKYKPYRLDGQPVEIVTQVTVNFVLPQ
jgi:TonB family protein